MWIFYVKYQNKVCEKKLFEMVTKIYMWFDVQRDVQSLIVKSVVDYWQAHAVAF